MPRDASGTRDRLRREAARVFAERGVYQATMREITAAAGQRNSSALAYHFGSREGVLWAILAAHNPAVDTARAAMIGRGVEALDLRGLVAALVIPYSTELATSEGRDYLRIVAQLTDLFPAWRDGPLSPPALRMILDELERRCGADTADLARQRVVWAVMLLTSAMAERARRADPRPDPAFLADLTDAITGIVGARAAVLS